MRSRSWLLTLALSLLSACGGSTAEPTRRASPPGESAGGSAASEPATSEAEAPPLGQLPSGVTPRRYALDLEVVPSRDAFRGSVDVRVRLDRQTDHVWMHGANVTLVEGWVVPGFEGELTNGPLTRRPSSAADARWEPSEREGVARVAFASPMGPGEVTIHLAYEMPFDRQLKGLYRVDVGDDHYAFTQFEATSARHAFPCFDEPRFKTPFDVTLRVAPGDRALANTRELESHEEGGLRRVRFAPTRPLPTYLVAMAVGPLDVVEAPAIPANDVRPAALPLRGIAARGRGPELRAMLERTGAILASLERYTNIAYPFDKLDIVAVPDFASGAMENPGLVTFRETLLLLPARAGEDQVRAATSVMAHELAHMWFGDLVTMPWWNDIWLNEAFATFMASRTVREVAPEQNAAMSAVASAHGAMSQDALASARRVRQPIESDHDIRNAFDGITYQKGAAILAMFEHFVGEDVFRAGIRRYLEAHREGTATADDLLLALSEAAGRDVGAPFRTFLDQSGVPLVRATLACGEGGNVVQLTQERFVPLGVRVPSEEARARWQIPVCVRYGSGRSSGEACALVTEPSARIPLPAGACPDWVHPNANADGYYRYAMPQRDVEALVTQGGAALSARERLSLANDLRAMVTGGILDADVAMRLAPTLSADPERLVADEPMGLASSVIEDWSDDAHREAARAWAAALYARRFERLSFTARRGEPGDDRLLRRDLAGFLVLAARDAPTRSRAAALGRAFVGRGVGRMADGALHPEAIEPELATAVLVAAIDDASADAEARAALFDHVLERALGSTEGLVRQQLLGALALTSDPALAERALALTLDPRLRVNEMSIPMGGQVQTPEGRERAFLWISSHLPELRERMATTRLGFVPLTFTGFCSSADRDRVAALFSPVIDGWPGGPRNLASTLEAIEACAARAERQRPSVTRALEAPEDRGPTPGARPAPRRGLGR